MVPPPEYSGPIRAKTPIYVGLRLSCPFLSSVWPCREYPSVLELLPPTRPVPVTGLRNRLLGSGAVMALPPSRGLPPYNACIALGVHCHVANVSPDALIGSS